MNPSHLPRHQRPAGLGQFLFGAPYYPEHWTPAERADDPERMAAAGVNVVRMAEFAWDVMEPREGEYDFSLFDETIHLLGARGIRTMLCTPTATPPRWLTSAHEEWLRVDADGRRMQHGSRQHGCTTHAGFRQAGERITRAMAEHFADNPHVIGWQTDNELNCHFSECFCPACEAGFRAWLEERYGSIEALNEAWGNRFWALTYDAFEQVPLPRDARPAYTNPGHQLDYWRFLSDATCAFQRGQVRVLREAQPRWWVMHNGLFRHLDYWTFAEDLDFLGVDVYPGFNAQDPVWAALVNENCRSASGGYIVPEQQGGAGGQKGYLHEAVAPGQMRLWAYQSIAHGADGMLHFRWRTCRFGAEENWNGILDADNVPRRRYEEFAREGAELARVGERILGTVLDVRAAVLVEHEQDEAHATMPHGLPGPWGQMEIVYRQLWKRHLPCGLVRAQDSLEGLKLVVLPSFPIVDADLVEKLRGFVASGGTLLVTARTGIKDRCNRLIARTPPGLLEDLTGTRVEEFGKIGPDAVQFHLGGTSAGCGQGYEVLETDAAEVLASWVTGAAVGPQAAVGRCAVARRRLGEGWVLHVGTFLTPENAGALLDVAQLHASIVPLADADTDVEVTCRHGAGRRLTFLLNHAPAPRRVGRLPEGTELLTGEPCTGEWQLEPFGVAIVEARLQERQAATAARSATIMQPLAGVEPM